MEILRNVVRISHAYFHRYLYGAAAWRLIRNKPVL